MAATETSLSPDDLLVWRRFISVHGARIRHAEFQVRVGKGARPWPAGAGPEPPDWSALTSKRIDVVAETDLGLTLIEVKPRASASALGQLLLYRDLYVEEKRPTTLVALWVVCYFGDADLTATALRYGVAIHAVGS